METSEKIAFVLNEVLEELKQLKQLQADGSSEVKTIATKINSFETLLKEMKVEAPPMNMVALSRILQEGIKRMEAAAFHPEKMVREISFHLFPKGTSVEFYQALFKWIAILTSIILLYVLMRQLIGHL